MNRIFGEDSPNGDLDTKAHFVNLAYSGFDLVKITGYGYFLDLEDAPAASNNPRPAPDRRAHAERRLQPQLRAGIRPAERL
ncbi:hypothetical protein ULF88_14695 [Halopseudomonas pachastrellae]|nr:hypothetical protein [Halopseudomonas pachastrellae]